MARSTKRISAGAAAVLGLSMAGVGLIAGPSQAVESTLDYKCELTNSGLEQKYEDPWKVALSVDVPEQVATGEAIPAPNVTATVTPGADAAERLRSLKVESLRGTAKSAYFVGDQERSVDLEIPRVAIPAEGPIDVAASGTGAAETAPAADGTLAIKGGDFTTTLRNDAGFVFNISCTAPADATIGEVKVGTQPTSSSTSTTDEPTSTSTSSTSSTSEPTSTSTSSTSSTSEPTGTSSTSTTDEPTSTEPTTSAKPRPFYENARSVKVSRSGVATLTGRAWSAGTLTVGVFDEDDKELKRFDVDVTEGPVNKQFQLPEGTAYIVVMQQGCESEGAAEEDNAAKCYDQFFASWYSGSTDGGSTGGGSTDGGSTSGGSTDDGSTGGGMGDGGISVGVDGNGVTATVTGAPGATPVVPGVVQTDGVQAGQLDGRLAAVALGGLMLVGAAASSTVVVARRRAVAQH